MRLRKGSIKEFIQNGGLVLAFCIVTVIILPVSIHYLPVVMTLWALAWIAENRSGLSKDLFFNSKPGILFLLFASLFVWQAFGLSYAESFSTGVERLFKRLSFVIFPLVLFYPGVAVKKNINFILRIFAFSTFLYVIICFGDAMYHSLHIMNGKWVFMPHPIDFEYENYFYGLRFSDPIHPSYLSLYIIISVLILFEFIFYMSLSLVKKSAIFFVILIFLITLYLLSARAGMLAAIIVFPVYFLFKLYNHFPKWAVFGLITTLVVLFVFFAVKNVKVSNSINNMSNQRIEETFKKDPRIQIWQSAMGVIKRNPILGVGTGDASSELKEEFATRKYFDGYYENMNAHNQFLEIWLENGIIGLLIFTGIFFYMSYIAVTQKNILLGLFIISTIIFFIFETMMNRLGGISFFSLFSFLLIYSKKEIP